MLNSIENILDHFDVIESDIDNIMYAKSPIYSYSVRKPRSIPTRATNKSIIMSMSMQYVGPERMLNSIDNILDHFDVVDSDIDNIHVISHKPSETKPTSYINSVPNPTSIPTRASNKSIIMSMSMQYVSPKRMLNSIDNILDHFDVIDSDIGNMHAKLHKPSETKPTSNVNAVSVKISSKQGKSKNLGKASSGDIHIGDSGDMMYAHKPSEIKPTSNIDSVSVTIISKSSKNGKSGKSLIGDIHIVPFMSRSRFVRSGMVHSGKKSSSNGDKGGKSTHNDEKSGNGSAESGKSGKSGSAYSGKRLGELLMVAEAVGSVG